MAGNLREFPMPGNPVSLKKRERTDAQDELWKGTGLQPMIEGKAEDDLAEQAKKRYEDLVMKQTEKDPDAAPLKDPKVMSARDSFLEAAKSAFDTRSSPPAGSAGAGGPGGTTPFSKTLEFAQSILGMGLSYVQEFMGMVGTRLADRDVRKYYQWKGKGAQPKELYSPLELEGVVDIETFVQKNRHLGKKILTAVVEQYNEFYPQSKYKVSNMRTLQDITQPGPVPPSKTTNAHLIGPLFHNAANQPATAQELDRLLASEDYGGIVSGRKKHWVFGALDLAAFEHILSIGSYGAMVLALGQLRRVRGCERFTLKQLLMSEGVRDIFAIFVAFQYQLASGGNAYAGRASEMGNARGTTFMLSAGLETRRMLCAQVETAKYWFQDVYEAPNPMYQEVEREVRKAEAEIGQLNPDGRIKAAMEQIARTDPTAEVVRALRATVEVERNAQPSTMSDETMAYVQKNLEMYMMRELLEDILPRVLVHAN